MKRLMAAWLMCLVWVAVPGAAAGDRLEDALQLYRSGEFAASETAAASIASPDALALAARAANVRALYLVPITERDAVLGRAQGHAEAALAIDRWHVDSTLQLVISVGHRARLMKPVEAHFLGMADLAKSHLDRVAAAAQDNAYYHALLGAWHAELVLRAGSTAAFVLYGARWKYATQHFETAETLAPDSIVIRSEFAKMLLDHQRQPDRAVELLRRVANATPDDAAEALVVQKATALLKTTLAKAAVP